MTDNKYIDIKGMEERVRIEEEKQAEQARSNLRKITEQQVEQQAEVNKLFTKAMLSEREENEKKKAKELEEEKAKAMKEVESKFESKGLKSEHTKQMDKCYKNLLDNIPGLND